MVTLHIVNQPESTWMKEEKCEGQSDTSLTALGKAQAKKIASHFSSLPISALYASNLHRTNQCAKIISSHISVKVKRDERLADMNLGLWQGKFPEEIEARYPDAVTAWKTDPSKAIIPQGESWPGVMERIRSFLNELHDDELFDKNVIIITHDLIVRGILTYIEKLESSSIWKYQLDKASITVVQLEPEQKIIQLNETAHLYVPSFN